MKKGHVHVLGNKGVFGKYNISNVKIDDCPFLKGFLEILRTLTAFKLKGWESYVFKQAFLH